MGRKIPFSGPFRILQTGVDSVLAWRQDISVHERAGPYLLSHNKVYLRSRDGGRGAMYSLCICSLNRAIKNKANVILFKKSLGTSDHFICVSLEETGVSPCNDINESMFYILSFTLKLYWHLWQAPKPPFIDAHIFILKHIKGLLKENCFNNPLPYNKTPQNSVTYNNYLFFLFL